MVNVAWGGIWGTAWGNSWGTSTGGGGGPSSGSVAWGDAWDGFWGDAWGAGTGGGGDETPSTTTIATFRRPVITDPSHPEYNEPLPFVREKSSRQKAEEARLAREAAEQAALAAKEKELGILRQIELLKAHEAQARGRAGIYQQGSEKLSSDMIALQMKLHRAKQAHALAHAERVFHHRKLVEDDEDDAMTMLATMLLH